MTYPNNFEDKIGFSDVRRLLSQRCLSTLGKERVAGLAFTADAEEVAERLAQVGEFRRLLAEADNLPLQYFFDVRQAVARLRLEGTHIEPEELFDLRRSLETIIGIVACLGEEVLSEEGGMRSEEGEYSQDFDSLDFSLLTPHSSDKTNAENQQGNSHSSLLTPHSSLLTPHSSKKLSSRNLYKGKRYPALYALADGVAVFPGLCQRIDQILDKYGKIKDTASADLARIRQELARMEGSISRTLYNILRMAQSEGLVEKDVAPTMRDGRLVIPIAPGLKRRVKGIVHDESATGKTVFVEPTEVVEANNRVRELEAEERREVIRILTEFSKLVRPHVREMLDSYDFLAEIDLLKAKAALADDMGAIQPVLEAHPHIDWVQARHPLLQFSLSKQGKRVVPLDITLTADKRLLIISGPNAGGKSVCLKTVGLLQYMLQCGLAIPVGERSVTGVFSNIMIDIGDEQSIEDDLSTYSSHLANMKQMLRQADGHTVLLIDEFGGGTEPQIGGAIAEAVLQQFCDHGAYGVITTHYQNLKHFAEDHEGVVNGAMLYDRHEMRPLFQLSIGRPGSSFAIEIARKIGLPEEVIRHAADIVGSDYIQSDKYLQDIVRDKRYWEGKRQAIHQQEKQLEQKLARYEADLQDMDRQRKEVLRRAKEQAQELLKESNRRIENTIREIREAQAEKEETKRVREELRAFRDEVETIDSKDNDELIARKIRQLQERKERKEKRRREKEEQKAAAPKPTPRQRANEPLRVGETVRIKGTTSVGRIEAIDGKMATAVFGGMRTKMRTERLERAEMPRQEAKTFADTMGRQTRETIDARRATFHQDIDVRGMRGDEAINAVTYFIDDAILVGMPRVRILHGTGNGILRRLIREYLATVPAVTAYRDEHVQFGGAGITVVDL